MKVRQRERLTSAYRIGNGESDGIQVEGIKAMADGLCPEVSEEVSGSEILFREARAIDEPARA